MKFQAIGGNYSAVQQSDGTFTIKDVPIFVSHKFERGDLKVNFNADWLKTAVKKAQDRLNDDLYTAPLHIHHNSDPGSSPEKVGHFIPKRVGPFQYQGKRVQAVFADLKDISAAVFEKIKERGFAGRSVEILDVDEPEFDSLALLPTKVPELRLPNLTIGEIKKEPAVVMRAKSKNGYKIKLQFDRDRGLQFGTNLGARIRELREKKNWTIEELARRISNNTDKGRVDPSTMQQIEVGDIVTPSAPMIAALAKVFDLSVETFERLLNKNTEPMKTERFSSKTKKESKMLNFQDSREDEEKKKAEMMGEDEDNKDKKADMADEDSGGDKDKSCPDKSAFMQDENCGMQDALAKIAEGIEKILQAVSPKQPAAEGNEELVEDRELEPVQMSAHAVGQIAGLKKQVDILNKKQAQGELCADARKKLELAGFDVDGQMENHLIAFAAKGKEALDDFVQTVKTYSEPDPPEILDGVMNDREPVEFEAYSEDATSLSKAREYSKLYETMPKSFKARTTLKSFLHNNMSIKTNSVAM